MVDSTRAFFDTLQRTQWAAPRELLNYQESQLTQLLKHAFENSLFYRQRLKALFRSDGSINWSRWREVPILTIDEVREHGLLMHCVTTPERHGSSIEITDSSNCERPLHFTMTTLTKAARQAAVYRFHLWHDLDWQRVHGAILAEANKYSWASMLDEPWGPPWAEAPCPRMQLIDGNTQSARLLEWLESRKIEYLSASLTTLLTLAKEIKRKDQALALRAALVFGPQISALQRATLRDRLNVPLLEVYGSEVLGVVAQLCPSFDVLHIASELVLVEVLDKNNRPCPPGKLGRVITTVFHNAAQPFIRFDQGEVAIPALPCKCGRGLPAIALESRSEAD